MMRRGWMRVLALCLSLMLLVGMASAAAYTLDLSGDGKVNVWDLQLAVNQSKETAHQTAILEEILGNPDELHKTAEGIYEIYSAVGLFNMARHSAEGETFVLMADVDLKGANWTPIGQFTGTLDGNGHTIKNFTVTKSSNAGNNTADTAANLQNMGFISTIERTGTVKNLKLEQATVVATENAAFIGLLTGSNRGKIIDCTTVGTVTDSRTTLAANVHVGTIAGRNNNGSGTITATSAMPYLEATAGSSNPADKVTGVTSKLGMDFATLSADSTGERKIGIAGYSNSSQIDQSLIWQDVSNDFSRMSATEQERRQGAVDEMYRMGTVQWTTSELLTFTSRGSKTSTHSNIYIPGTTYSGIPYNGGGGGYERALSVMQPEKDDQGRYVTVTGLEDGTLTDENGNQGFILTMGNNCSSAVGWAWAAVSPHRVSQNGAVGFSTVYMIPNEYNTAKYGILPSGGYQTLTTDPDKYAYGIDARDTRSIIALNGGAQGMAEYYAKAGRGDALLCVEYDLDTATDTWVKGTGHARLLAYEPVIIRDYKGTIDLDMSYAITHEQGDGLYDNRNASGKYDAYNGYNIKQTSWRIDYKYPLDVLLTEEAYTAANKAAYSYGNHPGCGWGYVPVTIPAYSYEGALRTPYYDPGYINESNYHPVILPDSGWYYSNWYAVRATMVITDADGKEMYNKTSFVMGANTSCYNVKLEQLFPDSAQGLTAGQTYYCTLKIQASNGTWYTKLSNQAFTYNPTT